MSPLLLERHPELSFILTFPLEEKEYLKEDLAISGEKSDTVYLIGSELFHHAETEIAKDQGSHFILIDDDLAKVKFFLGTKDAEPLISHPKISLFSSIQGESLESLIIHATKTFPFSSFSIYTSSRFEKEVVTELVAKTLTIERSILSEGFLAPFIYKNVIHHFHKLSDTPSLYEMKGAFAGIPAVICGAGPSLLKAIPFLRKIEDRALIFAGGSTIGVLSHHGISPHFQCIADPTEKEYRIIKGAYAFQTPAFIEARAHFAIDRTYNGMEIIVPHAYHDLFRNWFLEKAEIKPSLSEGMKTEGGVSVTTFAIDIAMWLGCNEVFLAGIDLAFQDQKKYASGSELQELAGEMTASTTRKGEEDLLFCESAFGKKVLTQTRWKIESAQIGQKAKENPSYSFFTLSKEGLGFLGIPYLSFEEALSHHLTKSWDLKGKIHQILSFSSENKGKEALQILGKSLLSMKELLEGKYAENVALYFLEEEIAFQVFLEPIWKSIERVLQGEKGMSKMDWICHTLPQMITIFQEEGLLK